MREKGLFPKVSSKKKAEVEVARKKMRIMQESSEEESSSNEEELVEFLSEIIEKLNLKTRMIV